MKDENQYKNYRLKFKAHYGFAVPNGFVIHHIDLDHYNNDICNLLLLPSELHHKYHYYLNATMPANAEDKFKRVINCKVYGNALNVDSYNNSMIKGLVETLEDIAMWVDYKKYLDGELPNIHNIKLFFNEKEN